MTALEISATRTLRLPARAASSPVVTPVPHPITNALSYRSAINAGISALSAIVG